MAIGAANNKLPLRPPSQAATYQAAPPATATTALSIAQLRWCRFQKVRADGANAAVGKLHDAPGTIEARLDATVAAYNAYIAPLNASCGSYSYRIFEAAIVDAEVEERRDSLAADGRLLMMQAYSAPLAQPASSPPEPQVRLPQFVAVARAPVASNLQTSGPGAVMSPAFGDGQADRRAWEAWVASMTGGFHDGAEWWSSVRSRAHPPGCAAVPGGIAPAAALSGCNQAKTRLARTDVRRRTEPNYRAGWNNP